MISSRAEKIPSFLVMDILEAAQELERAGEEIVHLEIGEPDFGAPEHVAEAVEKALREGKTRYTHCQGIIELREASETRALSVLIIVSTMIPFRAVPKILNILSGDSWIPHFTSVLNWTMRVGLSLLKRAGKVT